jgi:hypothetical protein
MRRLRTAAGILVILAILGSTLLVPAATAVVPLGVKLGVTLKGTEINYLSLVTPLPRTVDFAVNNSVAGATFFWQFGDGSNSTGSSPTHTYDTSCVYNVEVQMKVSNGSVESGELVFGAFAATGPSGRALAICPPQGTAGFIPVELAGGFFQAYQQVSIMLNGTVIGTATAGKGRDWVFDVTSSLASYPNDTKYPFTTSPASLTADFTTVEGIRATPTSGAPGTSVQITGRSYPPYQSVLVYLGGASLGTAQTDGTGSFLMQVQIPFVSPLTSASTYPYTTFPAIIGSQANFASAGALGAVFSSWWWWLLLIIVVLIAAYLVRRRMRRRVVSPGPDERQPTS